MKKRHNFLHIEKKILQEINGEITNSVLEKYRHDTKKKTIKLTDKKIACIKVICEKLRKLSNRTTIEDFRKFIIVKDILINMYDKQE